jgi:hypothetical protein
MPEIGQQRPVGRINCDFLPVYTPLKYVSVRYLRNFAAPAERQLSATASDGALARNRTCTGTVRM